MGAIRETDKKTHIIGLSNLNPGSFQSYLDFCCALQLVQVTPAGYSLTPRAEGVLEVIQRLLAGSAEVDAALVDLHRGFNGSDPARPPTQGALRFVSILAWNEVVRSAAECMADGGELLNHGRPVGYSVASTLAWLDRGGLGDPEEPVAVRDPTMNGADPPRGRRARTRRPE